MVLTLYCKSSFVTYHSFQVPFVSDSNASVNSRHVAYNFKVGLAINMTEKSHIESNFKIDRFKMDILFIWEQRKLVICFSPFEQAVKLSNTYACRRICDLNL